MSFWKPALVLAIIIFLGIGLRGLILQNKELDMKLEVLNEKLAIMEEENKELLSDIEYYGHPENLLKELKKHFNYKETGEEIIIIIPD